MLSSNGNVDSCLSERHSWKISMNCLRRDYLPISSANNHYSTHKHTQTHTHIVLPKKFVEKSFNLGEDQMLAWWLECSPMARETWVQSHVESYQRLKKWYLMPPCLTLSIIRYGSRVKWSNPGKGVAHTLHLGAVTIEKGTFESLSTRVANFT